MKDRTMDLLYAISQRLSSRQDCKEYEYVVQIYPSGTIIVAPSVYVYIDTHHRSKGSYIQVEECVLRKPQFDDIDYVVSSVGRIHVRTKDAFQPGVYMYAFGYKGKCRRRWCRIR